MFAQDGNKPVFALFDNLNEFGEWQTSQQLTVKEKKDVLIPISYRHKPVKKFELTCKFTVEIRNDSDKEIKFFYLAGNSRTNYFAGSVGTIKEKIKLKPGEVKEIDYPLPIKTLKHPMMQKPAGNVKSWNIYLELKTWKKINVVGTCASLLINKYILKIRLAYFIKKTG